MSDKQIDVAIDFIANWLEKLSIGCLLVGLFQAEHIFGGLIGGIICALFAANLKIWRSK